MANVNSGVYIAIFYLAKARMITAGRLGRVLFPAGLYLYVGSAQKNLSHRLERHARKNKRLRWQIDYLSCHATMVGAVVIDGKKNLECRLAVRLATRYSRPVLGFGASDCRCPGHLFYLPKSIRA